MVGRGGRGSVENKIRIMERNSVALLEGMAMPHRCNG